MRGNFCALRAGLARCYAREQCERTRNNVKKTKRERTRVRERENGEWVSGNATLHTRCFWITELPLPQTNRSQYLPIPTRSNVGRWEWQNSGGDGRGGGVWSDNVVCYLDGFWLWCCVCVCLCVCVCVRERKRERERERESACDGRWLVVGGRRIATKAQEAAKAAAAAAYSSSRRQLSWR